MKQERKVIHVYLKGAGEHLYFGSLKAIYSNLNSDELGLQYQSLINYFAANDTDIYENAKCVIRKGVLITQSTNRGKASR